MAEIIEYDPARPPQSYKVAAVVVNALVKVPGLNLSVTGANTIPDKENFVLAFTHHNSWDAPAVGTTVYNHIGRAMVFMCKEEILDEKKLSGRFLRRMGGIPISRNNKDKARDQLHHAADLLGQGNIIAVAEEGGRVDGDLIPNQLARTSSFLAARVGVPVVGAAVAGRNWRFREQNLAPLALVPRTLHVHFSKPLTAEGESVKERRVFLEERMRDYLQFTLNDAYDAYEEFYGRQSAAKLDTGLTRRFEP